MPAPSVAPFRKETSLSYALPPAIESIKDGWQRTCEAGATISSMFTVVSLLSLTFVESSRLLDYETRSRIHTLLALASYGALFFNLSASVSAFILIDRLGSVPFHAAQKPQETLPSAGIIEGGSDQLLVRYGVGKLWGALVLHWFCCYMMGIWCIVVQVTTYVWLKEDAVVKGCMTTAAVFSLLPLLAFASPLWKTVTGKP